ncbi:MAG: flagellar hook-basal body protein [Candidatus Eisenbacteria bacterium]|nr:flagellar hook-basal body complex protein [Candidatus Eisenbacteria bacterium]
MALDAISGTARSLSFYQRMQEVTANNLANAGSDGFKALRLTARTAPDEPHAVPVERIDLSQGDLRETKRPLDLALDGPGFFVVSTDHGERLTRGGSFRLDAAGRLTDLHGDPLLGREGPIAFAGAEAEILADGTVVLDGKAVDRLRIEQVNDPDDPAALLKEGAGRFVPQLTTNPIPAGTANVRQGWLEQTNFDPLQSMVDLITIQRAYAANVDALKAMDSVLGTVVGDIAKV